MTLHWYHIASSGDEVAKCSHAACGSACGWLCTLLALALLIGGSTALGQTDKSPSPKRERVITDTDRASQLTDTTSVIFPDETTTTPSGTPQQTGPHRSSLRREEPFAYDSRGRRDPCRPLISERKADDDIKTDLLRVDGAVLTGVVWSSGQYLAMVRDKDGNNFFLREGDAVFRGKLVTVTQTKAIFRLVDFGEVEQVILTVRAKEGEKDNK
jgi:hypothetical protein